MINRDIVLSTSFFLGLTLALGVSIAQAQTPSELNPESATNVITPPAITHFESAAYPPEAKQAGLEATVVLKLEIDVEGHVTGVEVAQPAGHGFDEAAVAAARAFMFTPARRGASNVASRILYKYGFTLSKPSSEPASAQPLAPKTGALRGVLRGGDPPIPLAGVEVHVRPPNAPEIIALTGPDGSFSVAEIAPGEVGIDAVFPGFQPVHVTEQIPAGKGTQVNYVLSPNDDSAWEVTVRGTAVHREVTHYELSRQELVRVPGTFGDALHAVEAMPSVARAPAFSGALIVRGSAPGDTQVFVEGTLVPQVFHYGSLSSVVPSEMIENLQFYPSNFSVRYGRATGGIIEVGLRQVNPDGKYHGSAQMDFINVRANAEGPLPGARGWSFMGGARGSYVDRWLVPVLRSSNSAIEGMPRYYDYQMYLERRLPKDGVFRVGFFGANDEYVPIEKNPKEWLAPEDSFGYLQSLLRLPLSSTVNLRASWSMGRKRSLRLGESNRTETSIAHLSTARAELSVKTGTLGIARLGTDVQYAPFSVSGRADVPAAGGALASQRTDSPSLQTLDLHGVYFRPAAFAEYELAPTPRTNVTAGLRLDYTKDTSKADLAPRISARQTLTNKPFSPVLKGAVGLFYQAPEPGQTLPSLGTPGLHSQRAVHSMLGFEQPLTERVLLSVEGFEKELSSLIYSRSDGSGVRITENSGLGRVYGVDLLLRYRPDNRFFGWVSYTLSRSTRTRFPDEPSRLFLYDQPHILNVLASYQLGRGWEIGGRFRYMSGFLYSSCFGGMYDNSTGYYRCYGPPAQKRLGPFHQLDIRLEKTWTYPAFKWSAYLDVINAYFHNSPDYAVPNYDYSGVKTLSLSLPILPSFGLRGEF